MDIKAINSSEFVKYVHYSFSIAIFLSINILSSLYPQSHSIMSYNIRYDNKSDLENNWISRRDNIIDIMVKYQPSIIGIQEGLINQVHYIDSCLSNYDYVGVGRDDGKSKGEYCAIYYDRNQFVLLKNSTFWLSKTPYKVSVGWDAALERICTYALLKDINTQNEFYVFNTHYDHVGKKARERSSSLILEKIFEINSKNLPVVLMGDFNSNPDSLEIKIIKEYFSDGLNISKNSLIGPTGTFNGFDLEGPIERRIDYIFTKGIDILSYMHIDQKINNNRHISDHLPVMIKMR